MTAAPQDDRPPPRASITLTADEQQHLVGVVTAAATHGPVALRRLWDDLVASHGAEAVSRVWQEALSSFDVGQT